MPACRHCGSTDMGRSGANYYGPYPRQQYQCRACGRRQVTDEPPTFRPDAVGVVGGECPSCGSNCIVKLGFNDRCNPPRRRYHCKGCGRKFLEAKQKIGYRKCPQCHSVKFTKYGIERQGAVPRQRFMCDNGHTFTEDRPGEFPFGREFYSDPQKLLKAARLMAGGRFSLQKIANSVVLNRYTVYKLYRILGSNFLCACGRPLSHRGHCLVRWAKSKKARDAFDNARNLRQVSKPNEYAWKYAKKKLRELAGIIENKAASSK
jgi:transposase-like protein